ncbi:hypothetical protein DFR28_1103 [Arenicella xantha]|uniref:Uncharacterized protein n=1 Tax=Arenicella xantha TaxID=644221 RepID=A0A395JFD9_9GAMM|nr:hypothetical protein DFR28_1103 [Arenicella xantha]
MQVTLVGVHQVTSFKYQVFYCYKATVNDRQREGCSDDIHLLALENDKWIIDQKHGDWTVID